LFAYLTGDDYLLHIIYYGGGRAFRFSPRPKVVSAIAVAGASYRQPCLVKPQSTLVLRAITSIPAAKLTQTAFVAIFHSTRCNVSDMNTYTHTNEMHAPSSLNIKLSYLYHLVILLPLLLKLLIWPCYLLFTNTKLSAIITLEF